jgi:hypothetical protein
MKFYWTLILFTFIGTLQLKAQSYSTDTNSVVVYKDERIDKLTAKKEQISRGIIRSVSGYRVQLYNGNDRNLAMQLKTDFMRRFPAERSYLTYQLPNFRLRVGNFTSRAAAGDFLKDVSSFFKGATVVPDQVTVNTLKD